MKLIDWWCEVGFVFAPCLFGLGLVIGLTILKVFGIG